MLKNKFMIFYTNFKRGLELKKRSFLPATGIHTVFQKTPPFSCTTVIISILFE